MLQKKISFAGILTFLCVAVAFGLFSSRLIEIPQRSALRGWDNSFYYMWVRSIVIDGDIDFANELEINNTLIGETNRARVADIKPTSTGLIPNKYGIGWGLLSLPFFLLADFLVLLLRGLGWTGLPRDGYNFIYQTVLQLGHLGYALLGLTAADRFVREFFDSRTARLAVLATWIGSMLVYYQALNLSMAHNLSFSLVAVVSLLSLRLGRISPARAVPVLAGLFLASGLLVVTRYQTIVYLLFPAYAVGAYAWRHPALAGRQILITLPLAVGPIALQLAAWRILYGSFLRFPYRENGEYFNWSEPALTEVLFSSRHGLFSWHPFLLIAGLGLVGWVWHRYRPGVLWLVSIGLTYAINAAWWCWWLGSSFGLRNFEATVLFLMIGTAFLFDLLKPYPRVLRGFQVAVIGAAIWNINLTVLYAVNAISRNEAVSWIELISTTLSFYPSLLSAS